MEYLAIATTSCHPALGEFARSSASEAGNPVQSMLQIWSLDCSNTRLFKRAVDTTSIEDEESLTLALGICVDVGEAWQLKWCPRGGSREDSDVRRFIASW
jgi:transcription factor C subunit 6